MAKKKEPRIQMLGTITKGLDGFLDLNRRTQTELDDYGDDVCSSTISSEEELAASQLLRPFLDDIDYVIDISRSRQVCALSTYGVFPHEDAGQGHVALLVTYNLGNKIRSGVTSLKVKVGDVILLDTEQTHSVTATKQAINSKKMPGSLIVISFPVKKRVITSQPR